MTGFLKRWLIFIKDRFSPLNHFLLIFFYFSSNAVVAFYSQRSGIIWNKNLFLGFFIILLVFFHLRIFDEIKDYKKDKLVHPERPLARGLITVLEAKKTAGAIILAELLLAVVIGMPAFTGICCVIIYSLLMYKEFFVSSWLKSRIVIYALTHTLISGCMSFFIFSCVTGNYFWKIPGDYLIFIIANWMIFNIFEFGRKTFAVDEENDLEDSYSKKFGHAKAAFIIIFMAAVALCAGFILGKKYNSNSAYFLLMGLLFVVTAATGILYCVYDNKFWGKIFRANTNFFIIFYYMITLCI